MTVLGARDMSALLDLSLALYLKQVAPRQPEDVSVKEYRLWLDAQIHPEKLPDYEGHLVSQRWELEQLAAASLEIVDRLRGVETLFQPMMGQLEKEAQRATARAIALRSSRSPVSSSESIWRGTKP